jgi:hypothetical protein
MKSFLSFFSESLSVNTSTWHQIELALKKKKIRNAVMNDGTNVRTHKLSEREKVKAFVSPSKQNNTFFSFNLGSSLAL